VNHNTFQELVLSPFKVHEILEFDISIWITHFCLGEISEISFLRLWGLIQEIDSNNFFDFYRGRLDPWVDVGNVAFSAESVISDWIAKGLSWNLSRIQLSVMWNMAAATRIILMRINHDTHIPHVTRISHFTCITLLYLFSRPSCGIWQLHLIPSSCASCHARYSCYWVMLLSRVRSVSSSIHFCSLLALLTLHAFALLMLLALLTLLAWLCVTPSDVGHDEYGSRISYTSASLSLLPARTLRVAVCCSVLQCVAVCCSVM